jgi:hypothetical protein
LILLPALSFQRLAQTDRISSKMTKLERFWIRKPRGPVPLLRMWLSSSLIWMSPTW